MTVDPSSFEQPTSAHSFSDSTGAVKALQVESNVCITGGVDGSLRIWDLDLAESLFQRNPVPLASPGIPSGPQHFESVLLGKAHPEDVFGMGADSGLLGGGAIRDDGVMREEPGAGRDKEGTPCVKTLDGHTKSVTSLYFDGNCLVSKTYSIDIISDVTFLVDRSLDRRIVRCVNGISRPVNAFSRWTFSGPSRIRSLRKRCPPTPPTTSTPPIPIRTTPRPTPRPPHRLSSRSVRCEGRARIIFRVDRRISRMGVGIGMRISSAEYSSGDTRWRVGLAMDA